MGYAAVTMGGSATLSAHNSEQDAADDAAWEDFQRRVKEIAAEPQYEGIHLDVWFGGR